MGLDWPHSHQEASRQCDKTGTGMESTREAESRETKDRRPGEDLLRKKPGLPEGTSWAELEEDPPKFQSGGVQQLWPLVLL